MITKTYRVLTVRQPWAQLIVEGIKPVENRTWKTDYRGLILIHAAAARDAELDRKFGFNGIELTRGAIIGCAHLVDIRTDHPSPFYVEGNFAWVLKRPRRIRPVPMPGRLSLFTVQINPIKFI